MPMKNRWKELFTQSEIRWVDERTVKGPLRLSNIAELKRFLDLAHIRHCLVKPYCEVEGYPLVETRELLPSFEADLWEHKQLPGFSMVALARPIQYFSEIFQFDIIHPIPDDMRQDHAQSMITRNLAVLQARMAKGFHDNLRQDIGKEDISNLENYPLLLNYLNDMDRAQVMAMDGPNAQNLRFYLAGVYASFPSDLDTEVKRYGLRIGRFSMEDPDSYEKNRNFVCQHLMELYGFPVASERRTSAALFSRRLHKMGEKFLLRTLSQSDRTLTTLWSDGKQGHYPHVEKVALVSVDEEQTELIAQLEEGGYFVDREKRVVILKVHYKQHKFSRDNVRQERALSVASQSLIHPVTGQKLEGVSIIRDTSNMFLRINDIVRGEYTGRVVYKRNEIVENTDTEDKRLKFLYAWLSKHQRRMIGYRDEFFANIARILDGYLLSPERYEEFEQHKEVYSEVIAKYSYIQQARKVRILEELRERNFKGKKLGYHMMLIETHNLLRELKFEIVSYFDSLVNTIVALGESILNNRYLINEYIDKSDDELTDRGYEIKRLYGKIVSLLDDFKNIKKTRGDRYPQSRMMGQM